MQLWSKQTQDSHYRVTGAGRSVRLFTNGVFHSQFNPANVFSGALWDCLSLPTLLHTRAVTDAHVSGLRILVLGVGGGAVLRQLRFLHTLPSITGVDLDAIHLRVAKRWFGVNHKLDQLIEADAVKWVRENSERRYDIIIDDLFGDYEGEPIRAVNMDRAWTKALFKLLAPEGLIVANFIDQQELNRAKLCENRRVASALSLSHPAYENCIGIFNTEKCNEAQWRNCLKSHPALNNAQRRAAKRLAIQKIRNS